MNAGYRGTVRSRSTHATGGMQGCRFNDNAVHVFTDTSNALGLRTLSIAEMTSNSAFGSIVIDSLARR